MFDEKNIQNIQKEISGKLLFNVDLSKFSWFNIGGKAKIFFKPNNFDELSFFLKNLKRKLPIKILGRGSNILIRDGGFDGVIIKFGKNFSNISLLKNNKIEVGTAAIDTNVSNFALNYSLSGFEFLSCIPGTIGGAIKMNSGCYGHDISKILLSVNTLDLDGKVKTIPASDIKFHYRGSNLNNDLIFTSAIFKGETSNKKYINEKINSLVKRKKNSQPYNIKTCGSTFKNPNEKVGKKAWELIKISNCEKLSFGDASISSKHCNFFLNNGSAKAKDLENLIIAVKKKVYEKTGINLELEIQIIGQN